MRGDKIGGECDRRCEGGEGITERNSCTGFGTCACVCLWECQGHNVGVARSSEDY